MEKSSFFVGFEKRSQWEKKDTALAVGGTAALGGGAYGWHKGKTLEDRVRRVQDKAVAHGKSRGELHNTRSSSAYDRSHELHRKTEGLGEKMLESHKEYVRDRNNPAAKARHDTAIKAYEANRSKSVASATLANQHGVKRDLAIRAGHARASRFTPAADKAYSLRRLGRGGAIAGGLALAGLGVKKYLDGRKK